MSGGFANPELSMDLDSIIAKSSTLRSGKKSASSSAHSGSAGARRGAGGSRTFRPRRPASGNAAASATAAAATSRTRGGLSAASSNGSGARRSGASASSSSKGSGAGFSSTFASRKHQGVSKAFTTPAKPISTSSLKRAALPSTFAAAGSKVVVSNLDFAVTEDDLKQIFTRCGPLKGVQLNYDCNGRSTGTAVIHYMSPDSAIRCINDFRGVTLDKRPLQLELSVLPTSANTPAVPVSSRLGNMKSSTATRSFRNAKSTLPQRTPGTTSASGVTASSNKTPARAFTKRRGASNVASRGTRPGRGGRRSTGGKKTLSDLDVDLDSYMSQRKSDAMQTD